MKRWPANFVIIGFLGIIAIDAFPFRNRVIDFAKAKIDWTIDVSGIWQGPWDLFAPGVDKENHRILVLYQLDNEEEAAWKSPDWVRMNCAEKFIHSRDIEFFDRIRNQPNSPAWKSYAHYLKTEFENESPGNEVREIKLGVISHTIPSPNAAVTPSSPAGEKTIFYSERFPAKRNPGNDR